MNIFKSLSQGDGKISETNITSFFSYLLNSTNELDNSFLILFFNLLDRQLSQNKLCNLLELHHATIREQITSFSKRYAVTAEPEFSVSKAGRRQDIDIFLKVSNRKDDTDVAYILIENKIKTASKKNQQMPDQFDFFTQTEDYQRNLPVYSLLLTSDFDMFTSMHSQSLQSNINSVWLRWTNQKNKELSVEASLRELLMLEQQAHIQPINPNTQFIIRSFIDYIVTEFSNPSTGERNFSFNGSDEVESAEVELKGIKYVFRRYENKMIRVFDEKDEVLDIEVLPLLREINSFYSLNIAKTHPTGTAKNTQVFGKEVISALNIRIAN